MSENPYEPSSASLQQHDVELLVPKDIDKKIAGGWVAGLISIAISLVFIGISFFGPTIAGMNANALVDVTLMAGLAYGVFRKSRICAVLLFLMFLAEKIYAFVATGTVSGIVTSLLFLWFFFQAVIGTFQFHRWKKENAQSPSA
jgi:serine/threonine-protein kinase